MGGRPAHDELIPSRGSGSSAPLVQQGDQRGDRRLAARRKSAARVLDTARFHRAPAALGETRWQRISTDLSVFPYITAVERNAALTATALRGSASRYNKGPLLPAFVPPGASANKPGVSRRSRALGPWSPDWRIGLTCLIPIPWTSVNR